MAIKVQGNTVIDDDRNINNIVDLTVSYNAEFEGGYDLTHTNTTGNTQVLDFDNDIQKMTITEDTTITFSSNGTSQEVLAILDVQNANPWDISAATYNSIYDYSTEDISGYGLFFKPDGTKMYITGSSNDSVYQYSLSSAWNVATASYDSVTIDVSARTGGPYGLFFRPNGEDMYITDAQNARILSYNLSTAWDLSTASYSFASIDVSGQTINPRGVFFKSDGTKMYVVGHTNGIVYQYRGSAWSTNFSYDFVSFDLTAQDTAPNGLFFKDDGTEMYVTGDRSGLYKYSLSTAWNVATASYVSNYDINQFLIAGPEGVFFKPDGTKFYILANDDDDVIEFSSSPVDITFPSNIKYN